MAFCPTFTSVSCSCQYRAQPEAQEAASASCLPQTGSVWGGFVFLYRYFITLLAGPNGPLPFWKEQMQMYKHICLIWCISIRIFHIMWLFCNHSLLVTLFCWGKNKTLGYHRLVGLLHYQCKYCFFFHCFFQIVWKISVRAWMYVAMHCNQIQAQVSLSHAAADFLNGMWKNSCSLNKWNDCPATFNEPEILITATY